VFGVRERHSGTYRLNIEYGGRDQSAVSMRERCGSTYMLKVEDGGSGRSVFSVKEGHSGTDPSQTSLTQ
jgi:hypothetical protein